MLLRLVLDALVFKLVLLVVLESNSTTSPGSEARVSTLESGFREDHCSEGPGPGFGKRSGEQFGARLAK